MRILVTGAAGLLGSHLVDTLLIAGHHVVGVDDFSFGCKKNLESVWNISNFYFMEHDISKGLFVHDLDLIFHLASLCKAPTGTVDASEVMLKNTQMLFSIIELAQQSYAPIIFPSTSDVYGNSKTFKEDDPLTIGPPTIQRFSYAMFKLFAEQILLDLVQEDKIKCLIFRIFGCFSERSSKTWSGGHIPVFIEKALKEENLVIHGDGLQTRSMCYVSDIIDGLITGMKKIEDLNGEIINLGSSEEMTILECAKMIIEMSQSHSKIVFKPGFHGDYPEIQRRFANTEKAAKLLGYQSKTNLRSSIQNIINYRRTQMG